jgi:DNA (cytosine-5)-methyltransferase 1
MTEKVPYFLLYSLFDGIGGFPLAYANSLGKSHDELIYVSSEIEEFETEVLAQNFPRAKQLGDVTKIKFKEQSNSIVTMGTPCTNLSVANNPKGKVGTKRTGIHGEASKLFFEGMRCISEIRPKYFIWENVFGILSANGGKDFQRVLAEIAKIGYDATWTLFDSQFFGLPHRRRRIYLVGVRDRIPCGTDLFGLVERDTDECRAKIQHFKESRKWSFKENGEGKESFAYYTMQRFDQYTECGVSSTIKKRDYKDFTDIVEIEGRLRRVIPKERLRLQGFPDYWFDVPSYTSTRGYKANGMSVPVVKHIFDCIINYDKKLYLEKAS